MNTEQLLKDALGLSDYQILVYFSLLDRTGTAGQLFRRLNINRATLYRVLEELVALNLVVKKQIKTRMYFEALHPDSLKDLYERKRITFEEKGQALNRAVQELLRKATSQPTDASITIEKGIHAHHRAMKLQLTCKEKIIRQKNDTNAPLYDYLEYPETGSYIEFQKKFKHERESAGIYLKLLRTQPIDPKRPVDILLNNNGLRETRILPSEILDAASVKVFDDYTILTVHEKRVEDILTITIRNAITAALMKSLFDYVFDRSITLYDKTPIPTFKTNANVELPVLGIGTSGVGGYWYGSHPYIDDVGDLDQLRHAMSKGMNYLDACLIYGDGHTVEILGKAIKNVPRRSLFINAKITRVGGKLVESAKEVEEQCNKYLKVLGTDYIDQLQIHSRQSLAIPHEEVIQKIGELITAGKVRHWGVSNYQIEDLKSAMKVIKEPLHSNEIPFGLFAREYEENGTLEYMYKHSLTTISFFTVRKGGMLVDSFFSKNNDHPLVTLAKKYNKTPTQVAINWVTHHPRTIALIKATNGTHVNENVAAVGWEMNEEDYKAIDSLNP